MDYRLLEKLKEMGDEIKVSREKPLTDNDTVHAWNEKLLLMVILPKLFHEIENSLKISWYLYLGWIRRNAENDFFFLEYHVFDTDWDKGRVIRILCGFAGVFLEQTILEKSQSLTDWDFLLFAMT